MGGSKFRFATHGGGMRYLGLYSAVYKTTREGQFEALLDDIRIQLDVKLEKVDDDVLESAGSPCIVRHEKAAWRFDAKGMKLSFKRSSPREKRSATSNNVKEIEVRVQPRLRSAKSTQNEMASVSLTEDYINEMLGELAENDNVLFHLHRITEVEKALRTHCDEDGGCLGAIADLARVIDGSGHLDSRVIDAPFVEIKNDHFAFLHLALNTVLSFQNRAAHHRIPYLRLETYMKLRIAQLFVDPSDVDGRYKWSARFEIVELKTSDVHTDFEEMKVIARDVQNLLRQHQTLIELPLRLNQHVRLQPKPAVFGHHRVTIPLNFVLDKKLLPPFQFFRSSFF
ncbi:hypothetical protein ANCDUO_01010 [Ancylostoma duodenale]|uniref:Uncharacterized protein n=1 Tax=Ancylostoma duodenale TaxID=51022 RepID=A0A0C2HGC9_9BILA|nr:hypothetical protein ANCDUO_01010 [Ancylostoma duodenale]